MKCSENQDKEGGKSGSYEGFQKAEVQDKFKRGKTSKCEMC